MDPSLLYCADVACRPLNRFLAKRLCFHLASVSVLTQRARICGAVRRVAAKQ